MKRQKRIKGSEEADEGEEGRKCTDIDKGINFLKLKSKCITMRQSWKL